ncbi:MAG: hypothetical protein WA971_08950, partial [Microbacterium sp.]
MRLRLVVRDTGAVESDVVLTAEPETTVGELASAIAGRNETALTLAVLHADAVIPLPPDQRLGDDLLAQGSTVRVIESTGEGDAQDPVGILTLLSGQWGRSARRRPLFSGVTTIGVDDSCDVVIVDPAAGPGRIGIFAGATIEIFDLDSGPGVQVDGDVADRVRV